MAGLSQRGQAVGAIVGQSLKFQPTDKPHDGHSRFPGFAA
jgi:hypothetical protein